MNNVLIFLNSNVGILVSGILLGLILWAFNKPLKNRLHVKNIKSAKKLLLKINAIAHDSPALVFAILRKESPFVFEELLLLALKQHNFRIQGNLRYTGDGGIDGTAFDVRGDKYLIQAKRYKESIHPKHVENFAAIVNKAKAKAGFFIHTGRTGKKSHVVKGNEIHIISGSRLINLLVGRNFLC